MSEKIDVNKTDESCRYSIFNNYYFLKVNSRFEPKVCDSCHNLMQNVISFNDVPIAFVKEDDYRIHFWRMN